MKKLTDTLEKHMHHFQCQQSEFKCKKVPRISNLIIGISHSFMHTMTVKTVSFCMIIRQLQKCNNNNALTFVSLYNFTQNQVFREVHIEHNIEFCTVKTNKSALKDPIWSV